MAVKEGNSANFVKKGQKVLKANGRQCYNKLRFSAAVTRSVQTRNIS